MDDPSSDLRVTLVGDVPLDHGPFPWLAAEGIRLVPVNADSSPAVAILFCEGSLTACEKAVRHFLAQHPTFKVMVISDQEESLAAVRLLRTGALGYIMAEDVPTDLVTAIHRIAEGEIHVSRRLSERLVVQAIHSVQGGSDSPVDKLSDRELEVLELLGRGMGTKAIAIELHLSVKTIETHRAHIKEKLGFDNASAMVRFAVEWVTHDMSSDIVPRLGED